MRTAWFRSIPDPLEFNSAADRAWQREFEWNRDFHHSDARDENRTGGQKSSERVLVNAARYLDCACHSFREKGILIGTIQKVAAK